MDTLQLALEAPPLDIDDETLKEASLFAPPVRLVDIVFDEDEQPKEIYSRQETKPTLSERLHRIWEERGDFSKLTRATLADVDAEEAAPAPPPEGTLTRAQIRAMQTAILEQLHSVRSELAGALDLLSVIAPKTDPPSVDEASLPLPPQTLGTLAVAAPAAPANTTLAAAYTVDAIAGSARAFFAAAAAPRPAHVFDAVLALETPYPLIPLGAAPGASLAGPGDALLARRVGVFFGCPESPEPIRNRCIVDSSEVKHGASRRLVIHMSDETGEEWDLGDIGKASEANEASDARMDVDQDEPGDSKMDVDGESPAKDTLTNDIEAKDLDADVTLEQVLARRSRDAFTEELFGRLREEVRTANHHGRTHYISEGTTEKIILDGPKWKLTLIMTPASKLNTFPADTASKKKAIRSLLKLLLVREYCRTRQNLIKSNTNSSSVRFIQTLFAYIGHLERGRHVQEIVAAFREQIRSEKGLESEVEHVTEHSPARVAWNIIRGDKEIGGELAVNIAQKQVLHISFMLPVGPTMSPIPQPSLIVTTSGRAVSVASMDDLLPLLKGLVA